MSAASILLFVIFLLLKVFHVVAWSWWIITLPLWLGFAVYLAITLIALLMAFVFSRKS